MLRSATVFRSAKNATFRDIYWQNMIMLYFTAAP